MDERGKEAPRHRVLVVEDESISALDLKRVLEGIGYVVVAVASTGEQAIEHAATLDPDVVLMDIRLRGAIDGITAAGIIAEREQVPIVYLTAYGDEDTIRRASVTHPFGYLLKPFGERDLHVALEAALFRRDLERRLTESEHWIQATLASLADGVIATSPTGHVRLMNAVAERLTGWNAADAIGQPMSRVLATSIPTLPPGPSEGAAPAPQERVLRSADGGSIVVEQSTTWIVDDRGTIIGTVTVLRDVTEARRASEALARQTEELARSNADLERFAYVASHDLREPLRMVGSYVELLARRYRGRLDGDADDFIAFASDGVMRMQALIDDLLAYARVGGPEPERVPIACEDVLAKVLSNLKATIEESGAKVVHEPLPIVAAEETELVQLFQNLIANAIKFRSGEPPRIRVTAAAAGDEWRFAVVDNGVGIAAESLERVFGLFQRLSAGRAVPGTGVGLAICKRIVERHRGRIWVESTPGRGSTFHFTLPRMRDPAP